MLTVLTQGPPFLSRNGASARGCLLGLRPGNRLIARHPNVTAVPREGPQLQAIMDISAGRRTISALASIQNASSALHCGFEEGGEAPAPRVLFEAIESRVEDDRGRYLVVLSKHDQSVRLFDEVVSSPFGISPTGIAGVRMSPVRPNRAASPAGMRKPPHLRSDHLRRERPRSAIRASIVALIATRICFSLAMFPKS
jgi:hypothetical protein